MSQSSARTQLAAILASAAGFACVLPVLADHFQVVPKYERRACADPAITAGIRCGVVRVPENYSRPRERQIELNVTILPAKHPTSRAIAQYDLDGGPGLSATDFLSFYAGEGAPYRRTRDVVLAEMRGTGRANPLRCPGIEAYEHDKPLAPLYPPELVADCVKDLETRADLSAYSTLAAARDMDMVRAALGYRQLDLNALSYGTTLALRYIAEYPQRVHAAVLVGTVPPQRTPPRYHAMAAERALRLVIADCAKDAKCAHAFGDPEGDLHRALARTDEPNSPLTREVFMERLRVLMYTTSGQRRVPLLLHQAAQGDFAAFTATDQPTADRPFADGLYLAITCAESFEGIDVAAAIAASDRTSFGSYRLERQAAACAHWPHARPDPDLMQQGTFMVPVLLLAGEMDPVSPPEWAAEALTMFSKGRLEVIRHGGHLFEGLSGLDTCFDRIVVEFFDSGSATDLDTACLADMRPTEYVTSLQPSR